METLRMETVLELVSAEICRRKKYTDKCSDRTDIPSLHEQMLLVQEVMPLAMFDGRSITFGEGNGEPKEIPFFNYLLLHPEPVFTKSLDGTSSITDYDWRIIGFSSFKELDDFVQGQEFLCGFSIYIRQNNHYKQAQYRMAFQRPGEKKIYTDEWGFYYPDADLKDIYSRNSDYKYFFEIVGLCELYCQDGVWCYISGSLDDLDRYLQARADESDLSWVHDLGKITGYRFQESGKLHYEGNDYTYCIEVDTQKTAWALYDTGGNPYCVRQHAFCSPERTCCEESHSCKRDCIVKRDNC